ncbi:MAG: LysR family transcriptional regulator [Verrucomicrobiota bacterium]|nr:LysR family transcriptional regulator [Verrucomicrobiota bacterium]MDD8046196.1 LysR family transcriptional regulator [Verrucomicrobiota bacterium]
MHLVTFRIFRDIVDSGSFSKAAGMNHISQSAVSQQIRAMEDTLGARLLDRTGRRIQLTPEGEVAYVKAQELLQTYDRMCEEIRGIRHEVQGTIRLATVYSVGLHELPPYSRQFLSRYPQVSLKVAFCKSEEVYEQVIEGAVDLGLVAFPSSSAQVEVVPFRTDRLALVCAPSHPLAQRSQVRLSDLSGMSFVAFEPHFPTRRVIDLELANLGVTVNVVLELDNIETLKQAIEVNTGVSILPRSAVQPELERGTLALVALTEPDLDRSLGILVRRGRTLTPTIKAFLEMLRTGLGPDPEIDD